MGFGNYGNPSAGAWLIGDPRIGIRKPGRLFLGQKFVPIVP